MTTKRQLHNMGFTLIEMLAVMAIMLILMTIAMVNFFEFGKRAAMRGAILDVKSSLVSARQWAITHRDRTTFCYGNIDGPPARGYILTTDSEGQYLGNTNYLPAGIVFTNSATNTIIFKLDGSCAGSVNVRRIAMFATNTLNAVTNYIEVYPLTGRAKLAVVE